MRSLIDPTGMVSFTLCQLCILHIPLYFRQKFKFPPYFHSSSLFVFPLLWPWCIYASCLTRTRCHCQLVSDSGKLPWPSLCDDCNYMTSLKEQDKSESVHVNVMLNVIMRIRLHHFVKQRSEIDESGPINRFWSTAGWWNCSILHMAASGRCVVRWRSVIRIYP